MDGFHKGYLVLPREGLFAKLCNGRGQTSKKSLRCGVTGVLFNKDMALCDKVFCFQRIFVCLAIFFVLLFLKKHWLIRLWLFYNAIESVP
ncbi:hypothetical protein CEXT_72941 [Caerostris extrusa]|uniref:Uncharacterized protein n=1 Tax=Caerostris extrusa TaxID=172846 RepID=A0AAV4R7B9_CAEEX|nr:hypothetical protein CEXT_72941 [Caerostris extrusa]